MLKLCFYYCGFCFCQREKFINLINLHIMNTKSSFLLAHLYPGYAKVWEFHRFFNKNWFVFLFEYHDKLDLWREHKILKIRAHFGMPDFPIFYQQYILIDDGHGCTLNENNIIHIHIKSRFMKKAFSTNTMSSLLFMHMNFKHD